MFVFKASVFIEELKIHNPEMARLSCQAFENAVVDSDFIRLEKDAFDQIKGDSIDYAVMEKTRLGKVVKLDAGWDDVGSWSALWQINEKDAEGNAVKGDAILLNSKNSYFNTRKTVAAIGVENLVVVESDKAILVCSKDMVQDVKKAAEQFNTRS